MSFCAWVTRQTYLWIHNLDFVYADKKLLLLQDSKQGDLYSSPRAYRPHRISSFNKTADEKFSLPTSVRLVKMRTRLKKTVLILLGFIPCTLFVIYFCGDTGFSIIPSHNAMTSKSNPALSARRRLITERMQYVSNFTSKMQNILQSKDENETDFQENARNQEPGDKERSGVQLQNPAHLAVTFRPKNCNGCFNSEFPMLRDQPDVCKTYGNQTIELIFLIISEPRLYARREAIRETWASVTRNNTSNFRHVFLFGSTSNYRQQQDVMRESGQFRDVLVSGFHDSYNNLTLKTMMGLRWAVTRCRHARFFMKVDDDVWISPDVLKDILRKKGSALQSRLGGYCHNNTAVLRNPTNKWTVPYEHYPYSHYPAYCGGPAYLGGMDVAEGVVGVSKDVPFFLLEDVYVGMCLRAAGIRTLKLGPITVNYFNAKNICYNKLVLAAIHRVYPPQLRELWAAQCDDQLRLLGVGGSNPH